MANSADDGGYVHERVALWSLAAAVEGTAATSHVILTLDGNVYKEAADYSGFRLLGNAGEEYQGVSSAMTTSFRSRS